MDAFTWKHDEAYMCEQSPLHYDQRPTANDNLVNTFLFPSAGLHEYWLRPRSSIASLTVPAGLSDAVTMYHWMCWLDVYISCHRNMEVTQCTYLPWATAQSA